jgi:hypothetical protein
MSQVPPDFNPYASPACASEKTPVLSTVDMVRVVKQYRQQMHSLGTLWIIIGCLGVVLGTVFAFRDLSQVGGMEEYYRPMIVSSFVMTGVVWFGLGILTCLKQMWAVWIGLILSYVMVLASLLNFNLCGIVVVGAAIFQAHRVIGWAKEMQRRGIPLSTRPQDIQTSVNVPPQRLGP